MRERDPRTYGILFARLDETKAEKLLALLRALPVPLNVGWKIEPASQEPGSAILSTIGDRELIAWPYPPSNSLTVYARLRTGLEDLARLLAWQSGESMTVVKGGVDWGALASIADEYLSDLAESDGMSHEMSSPNYDVTMPESLPLPVREGERPIVPLARGVSFTNINFGRRHEVSATIAVQETAEGFFAWGSFYNGIEQTYPFEARESATEKTLPKALRRVGSKLVSKAPLLLRLLNIA
jgi:hypothetical protein